MTKKVCFVTAYSCLILGFLPCSAAGRPLIQPDGDKLLTESQLTASPAFGVVAHRVGQMVLCVRNDGNFGACWQQTPVDFYTGEEIPSCEFPKGSNTHYLWGSSFWIGAVVNHDTLVSTGWSGWFSVGSEFAPEQDGLGEIDRRAMGSIDPAMAADAVSEEDYISVYYDTLTTGVIPDYFGRPHIPLNIEVTERSYAWSYSYAEDFILFDYTIQNIGRQRLSDVYMGIFVDGDVYWGQTSWYGMTDDICGFVQAFSSSRDGCVFWDTVNIAWIADNDGDPYLGAYNDRSVTGVTGTRIIRTPADSLDVSFNWWISNWDTQLDFGPREIAGVGRLQEDFRDFGTGGLGTPEGDHNAYYQMRNMEFDYDQIYTATIGATDPNWLQPTQSLAGNFADGFDTRYLLSFGPFDIDPGERLPISFAYVGGENFHVDPNNINNLPDNPDTYYENVDFSDLALNAAWAGRVYDNPGVDTDGDGYFGKVRFCCDDGRAYSLNSIEDTLEIDGFNSNGCELSWYEGDGVPDFRAASPPPGPDFWLEPSVGKIRVRINGLGSETARDVFSGRPDFEGYRVYVGRDERETSFSVVGSYDREDYNKLVWDGSDYRLYDIPYTLDSLRCLYGISCDDSLFHPLLYTRDNPYQHPLFAESLFYFTPQDFNASEFGTITPIRRTYPDQPYPSSLNPDSVTADELTDDGRLKYFEYETVIEGLLPTVPYYVSVTAFDFGSPEEDLEAMESAIARNVKMAYAERTAGDVLAGNLKAYVYPNPYRSDGDYRDAGFEGRMETDRPDHRVRAINFANLPPRCTISIYSLDGDLVRTLEHDADPADPTSSHESWNLITRNTQMVVSGLYYWVVEAESGHTQIGKLVIIM